MRQNTVNIIVPAAGLLALGLLLAVLAFIKRKNEDKYREAISAFERCIVDNYVAFLLCCMVACPLVLQLVYSIPGCKSVLNPESVLGFWGVLLGLIAAVFSFLKKKQLDEDKRRSSMSPEISVKRVRHGDDDQYCFELSNLKQFTYSISKLCDCPVRVSLMGGSSTVVSIGKDEFDSFNSLFSELSGQSKGIDVADGSKRLSLELTDPDMRFWHIDYRFIKDWNEEFRFYRGVEEW